MNANITIKTLKDGRMVIESRLSGLDAEYLDAEECQITGDMNEPLPVGTVGTVYLIEDVNSDRIKAVGLCQHPDGVRGNSNPAIRRHHGWRGTTNNSYCAAHGRREILESRALSRGVGWRTVLSADLAPDEA